MVFFGSKKKEQSSENKLDMSNQSGDDGHCLISGNLYIRGDVHFAGTLRVDGRVDGKIAVFEGKKGMLILSRGALVNGPVQVDNMIADGTVNGDIYVEERIECRANAIIRGEVRYESIDLTEGARLEGRCLKRDKAEMMNQTAESNSNGAFLATREVNFLSKDKK